MMGNPMKSPLFKAKFKTLDQLPPPAVEALRARLEALTRDEALRFSEADPGDYSDREDATQLFADHELDGLILFPEQVLDRDEYGFRTVLCAYFTLSHAAFSGGAVWDNANGKAVFRITDLRVRDDGGFSAWVGRNG